MPEMKKPRAIWRGGKPRIRAFLALQEASFLPTLRLTTARHDEPTVEFVQNDIITAFFGKQEFEIDYQGETIFMNAASSPVSTTNISLDEPMPDAEPSKMSPVISPTKPNTLIITPLLGSTDNTSSNDFQSLPRREAARSAPYHLTTEVRLATEAVSNGAEENHTENVEAPDLRYNKPGIDENTSRYQFPSRENIRLPLTVPLPLYISNQRMLDASTGTTGADAYDIVDQYTLPSLDDSKPVLRVSTPEDVANSRASWISEDKQDSPWSDSFPIIDETEALRSNVLIDQPRIAARDDKVKEGVTVRGLLLASSLAEPSDQKRPLKRKNNNQVAEEIAPNIPTKKRKLEAIAKETFVTIPLSPNDTSQTHSLAPVLSLDPRSPLVVPGGYGVIGAAYERGQDEDNEIFDT